MNSLIRSLKLAVLAGALFAGPSAFAGDCCIQAVANAKAGRVCEHTLTKQCCKDAVAKAGVADQSKSCPKCLAMKKKAKESANK